MQSAWKKCWNDMMACKARMKAMQSTAYEKPRYTADIKDPAMMSDEFVDAFYHLLASAMAMPLVDSASMQQTNYQLAQMAVQAAKWENMVESAKRTRYPHGYSDARFR